MLRHALYNGFCCSNGMYGISRDRNVYAVYVGFCHFYVFFNLYFKENAGYKEETLTRFLHLAFHCYFGLFA